MIIIEVAGGLGNQLQQYALYRKFVSLGKVAKLDLSWFEEKKQEKLSAGRKLELEYLKGVAYEVCSLEERRALVGSQGVAGKIRRKLFPCTVRFFQEKEIFHPELLSFHNMYIRGYFACEKYYVDILPRLREEIRFPENKKILNQKLAQEMKACESVSIHVRRGDYLEPENEAMFGGICTDVYYSKAISMIKAEIPEAHFYVFSDDISFARQRYSGKEYTIVDINHGSDSFYDIWLMSRCKHNICANSTFSFWGARLNGNRHKVMVRPTIHKNGQSFVKEDMEVLWQGWRFIDPQGKIR